MALVLLICVTSNGMVKEPFALILSLLLCSVLLPHVSYRQHRVEPNPVLSSPIIIDLASKHSRSAAEVVLSWALHKGMSVIPRSSKQHHIAELARLLKNPLFLYEGDIQAIDAMSHDDLTEL